MLLFCARVGVKASLGHHSTTVDRIAVMSGTKIRQSQVERRPCIHSEEQVLKQTQYLKASLSFHTAHVKCKSEIILIAPHHAVVAYRRMETYLGLQTSSFGHPSLL